MKTNCLTDGRSQPALPTLHEEDQGPLPKATFLVSMLVMCLTSVMGCEHSGSLPPEDMSLKRFLLQTSTKPMAVQVDINMDTHYNLDYSKSERTHYSFDIYGAFDISGDSPWPSASAYALKTSDCGRRLHEMLKNGQQEKLTVRLQRVGPEGNPLTFGHSDCIALVGIVDKE